MRLFSNIAADTVLTADPGVSGTTITGVDFTGWPSPSSGDTALACLDFGMGNVELVEYSSRTATSLSLLAVAGRGVDGTTAGAHNVGASVRHVASASDIQSFMRYGDFHAAALKAATWYPPNGVTGLTTGALASGTLRIAQFTVPVRTHFLNIGVDVTVAGTNVRFGIWRAASDGSPGTLILDSGVVGVGTTGFKSPGAGIDVWLSRGLYHLGVLAEGGSVTVRCVSSHVPPARVPVSSTTSTSFVNTWQATGVATGGLPNPFPAGMVPTNTAPYVLLLTA